MPFALAAALLSGAACTSEPPADSVPCTAGVLGDPSKAIDFDFIVANADSEVVALHDGDPVPLTIPPQGGHVTFVGVRATNLEGCGVDLTGALRDETTRQVRFDERTINLIPSGDGWGATGPIGMPVSGTVSNFANIPACPNQWASTDVDGHEFALEVTVKDRGGRSVEKSIHVVPTCQPGDLTDCVCTCAKGYVLGSTCAAPDDAGIDGS